MFCLLQAGIGSEEETVQDSTPDALEGGVRFGVYEIDCHADGSLCELGRGAMGVTYRATDTSLQRKVALKIIKTDIAERSADARERFVREARAAAALRHEHIATVYQFGMRLETGQYFYAMELIEGETLDERVHRAGPLDARSTIGIAEQVTSALAAAEKHGLVHRDLKPANLMLVNADDPEVMGSDQARSKRSRIRALRKSGIPVVKIIDFGLAKAFHTATDPKSLTHDRFVGTPAFASPEQFEHSALDVRSDIYSLGETLWFALTGKPPFAGRTLSEIHRAQKSNALPIEQLKAAHVPHRLKSLLESMLAFEPASRPGTRELAARLQRCSPEARSARRTRVALAVGSHRRSRHVCTFRSSYRSRIQNAALNPAPDKSIAVLPFENLSEEKAERLFRRWRAGRNSNGSGQDRRSESDQPHVGDAIQERTGAQSAQDRPATRCCECGGRKRAARRQSRARQRAVDRCAHRHASLGADLRPRSGGRIRDSKRDRQDNCRSASQQRFAGRKRPPATKTHGERRSLFNIPSGTR